MGSALSSSWWKCVAFSNQYEKKAKVLIVAKIAILAGFIAAGIGISILTGGLGTFAVGAWASDIAAGAVVGASIGKIDEEFMYAGTAARFEGDDDEN
jgi:hypothetical protein